jgi:predicted HTH domain antitoxin
VKWHELGRVSQGRGAEICGLSRAAFIDALSRYRVSPFQYTEQELINKLRDAD